MRLIKMFGLAAVAAMAFVGASSATATTTQLCTNHTGTCTEPGSIHVVSEGKATLLNSFQQVECNVLIISTHLKGLAAAGSGGQVDHVLAGDLRYTNCEPCTVTTLAGGLLFSLRTGHEVGTIIATNFKVQVTCFLFFNCVYNSAGLVGQVLGPLLSANGTSLIHYNKAEVKNEGGKLCPPPPAAELDALFTTLDLLYIRE
jgi:hypothetical protein